MSAAGVTRLAMAVAGFMLAHQVAAKALRDTVFLSAWPAQRLPAMVFATAVLVVAAVPLFARLLARFSPRVVVPLGFLASAAAHLIEWRAGSVNPWVAVVIYLHVAGLGALLLSGFWSHISELFDPKTAKRTYGRIAAAGTLGGLGGGVAAERMAVTLSPDAVLLFLAVVHLACASGMALLPRPSGLVSDPAASGTPVRLFPLDTIRAVPHLKTLALLVLVTTAGAAVVDYVLKAQAAESFPDRTALLRFFAIFYTTISIVTFVTQAGVGPALRRLGLGRTVSSLPLGLGATSMLAMIFQTFGMFAFARGTEAVLRGSLFRSGYELLFVPMDPEEKRRTKTFLDVTCDRSGDALGAVIVQMSLLLVAQQFLQAELLAAAIALAAVALWLGKRLDALYVHVVERRLAGQMAMAPAVIGSETGWTIVEMPAGLRRQTPKRPSRAGTAPAALDLNPKLRVLADLISGDRGRVEQALARLRSPDAMQFAAVVQLLAWDDVVSNARKVLEDGADSHVGLLIDALLDPDTDFAIRRRIPRILATLASQRTLDGLVRGLDDPRFEVRYRCGRAIDRLLQRNGALRVDDGRLLAVVERELSVPIQVWRGHHLIDRDEHDEVAAAAAAPGRAQKNIEHIFALLATVLPREPLQVALSGVCSEDRALRGLAREYLDSVLPEPVRRRLWRLMDAPEEPPTGRTPDEVLAALRRSSEYRSVQ